MSIAASSCRHACKSLFLHTVGCGPWLARQNQERLGDPNYLQVVLENRSHQEAPCCRMSLRQCGEKNISSVSSHPATPILHQFLPILLLLKGLHTLDRTVAFGYCSKKRQSGCIHRSGGHGPRSSAFSVPRPMLGGCKAGSTRAHHRVQGFLPQQAQAASSGLRSCSSLLRPTSGQEEGGQDTACQGGKVSC